LQDNYSIKEVLTFPFMKDVVEEKSKTAAEVVDITPKPEEGIRKSTFENQLQSVRLIIHST
jgi:lysyl-tRNA synthetase class 2